MVALKLVEHRVELGEHVFRQSIGAGIFLVEQQPGDAVLVGAQPPIGPGARLLRRFVDGERAELDVAFAENGERRLWRRGGFHALALPPLRSAWRPLARHRCIRWRCRAYSRAASWH